MAITTQTEIAGPVNVIFQQTLLRNAKANCPYFTGTVPAEVTQHQGTYTAKWRRIENLTPTTTALTELTGSVSFPTRVGTQPTVTDTTATVSKYGDYIMLNEEVDLVNFNGQTDKLMEVLGIQAGRSLNRLQRNIFEDSLTAILSGSATTVAGINGNPTASGFIKRSEIQNVVNTLNRNDALPFRQMTIGSTNIGTTPIRNTYIGICHPDVEEDIRVQASFQAVETYAGQTDVWQYEFGTFAGVRWVSTTESTIDASAGIFASTSATTSGRSTATLFDVYNSVIYGQDCVGSVGFGFQHTKERYQAGDKVPGVQVINHAKGSAGAADPLNEVSTLGWKSYHAGVVLNSAWGRVYRSAASLLRTNE